MSKNNSKPFYRRIRPFWEFRDSHLKHHSLSNVFIHGDTSVKNLKKLYTGVDISMLTNLRYCYNESFRDSHLAKILKKAKNLKNMELDFGHRIELFRLGTLFQAIGGLKLKSLAINYAPFDEPTVPSNYIQDLMALLKKMTTVENLKLKFQNVIYEEELHSITYTLPLYNLKRLQLTFKCTNRHVEQWLLPLGKSVSKALYRNLGELKTLELRISKRWCPNLTPLMISKFLENFDKVHLTNQLKLKVALGYQQNENYPGYTLADLFLMLAKKRTKFKMNLLKISHRILSQDLETMAKRKQYLPMNYLCLSICDDWDAGHLENNLKYMELFKPKKGLKLVFPQWLDKIEHFADDYDFSDDEEEDDTHLFDVVLSPMLSRVTKNMTFCIELEETMLHECDYERLSSILADVHKPISHLDLILPNQEVSITRFISVNAEEMTPALISLICSMHNVKSCVVNIDAIGLGCYRSPVQPKQIINFNKNSSLEKLELRMSYTKIKPKALLQALKKILQLPKFKAVDVFCHKTVYQACKAINSLKARDGKGVSCTFIQDDFLF